MITRSHFHDSTKLFNRGQLTFDFIQKDEERKVQSSSNQPMFEHLITLSWSFSGQNLAAARLTRTNPDGKQTPLYGGADVTSPGSYDDLACYPGTLHTRSP